MSEKRQSIYEKLIGCLFLLQFKDLRQIKKGKILKLILEKFVNYRYDITGKKRNKFI